ncbi:MAG TPA: hypothetical protein VFI73_11820, partial [Candidatus Nitrosopolaris sp.]|nr:hypothetical protein [Candidatus Nitrosopolaris sp.]
EHRLDVVMYLDKYSKSRQQNDILTLPIYDATINDVHTFSKYCRDVLDILFENQRGLLKAESTLLNNIEFAFLEFVEPVSKVEKMRFNI